MALLTALGLKPASAADTAVYGAWRDEGTLLFVPTNVKHVSLLVPLSLLEPKGTAVYTPATAHALVTEARQAGCSIIARYTPKARRFEKVIVYGDHVAGDPHVQVSSEDRLFWKSEELEDKGIRVVHDLAPTVSERGATCCLYAVNDPRFLAFLRHKARQFPYGVTS